MPWIGQRHTFDETSETRQQFGSKTLYIPLFWVYIAETCQGNIARHYGGAYQTYPPSVVQSGTFGSIALIAALFL